MQGFCTIPDALEELRHDHMLIVVDNPKRENQGDLIFPAQQVTTERVNFMIQRCRGFVCTPIVQATADQLDLPLMVPLEKNTEKTRVNFTVTVDAKSVASFGISAEDRTKTIRFIADKHTKPNDLTRPGHVLPLLAVKNGLREREGHTEATLELMRLAGYDPCGVLCEILDDNGAVVRVPELFDFAKRYKLKLVTISDLIAYS